jgi:hypothetical protein
MPIIKTTIMSCDSAAMKRHQGDSKYVVKTAHAPGIVCDRCQKEPYVYTAVFFGATRTYEEDEGWQPASSQRRRKRGWKGADESEVNVQEDY